MGTGRIQAQAESLEQVGALRNRLLIGMRAADVQRLYETCDQHAAEIESLAASIAGWLARHPEQISQDETK